MELTNLPKIVAKSKKRVGHGFGSGKGGHTSSRGQKGQKSRGKIFPLFEGTKTKKSLLQRLPLQRGKGKLKSISHDPLTVQLSALEVLPQNSKVDVQLLVSQKIVGSAALKKGVKILNSGKITRHLNIFVPISKEASKLIEKAGGTTHK